MLAPFLLRPMPAVAAIRVAALDLRGAPALPAGAAWLSGDERARATAMHSSARRREFIAGRWLLQRVAREAFPGGHSIRISDGRPCIDLPAGSVASCSISHSAGLVVCAAGPARATGIDVERIRPRRYWEALCERVLHPVELQRVRGLEGAQRWRPFYEIWVFKEAVAKALGIGLGFPFRELAVSGDYRIQEAPDGYGLLDPGWNTCALDVGEGAVAALAWRDA
jgi:phosphopantetheinyl transferase